MRSMVEGISPMLAGPQSTVKKARKLRKQMTWPEVILWRRLRQRPCGLKFRRQHPAGQYVLDFFCSDARVAIEINGMAHDLGNRPAHDDQRAEWLADRGVAVIRLSASEVTKAPDAAAEAIVAKCLARTDPLHHPATPAGPPPRPGEEASNE